MDLWRWISWLLPESLGTRTLALLCIPVNRKPPFQRGPHLGEQLASAFVRDEAGLWQRQG